MATTWINLTELKRQVAIRAVLERHGFLAQLTEKKPGKLVGPCPLHGGTNKTSFSVDTERNIYNCFADCGGRAGDGRPRGIWGRCRSPLNAMRRTPRAGCPRGSEN